MEYRSRRKQILPRVGYVPQSTCRHLIGTVESRLRSVGSAIGGAAWAEAIRLADQIGLDLHQPLRSLSIQENTLMTLVAAWMHSPDLLLLDEPSRVLTQYNNRRCSINGSVRRGCRENPFLLHPHLQQKWSACVIALQSFTGGH